MLIRTPADLGAIIRDRRKKLGMDQATLAKHVGVSRHWVISIEHGRGGAELGLVLRALDTLGVNLSVDTVATERQVSGPSIDLDAIINSAKKER